MNNIIYILLIISIIGCRKNNQDDVIYKSQVPERRINIRDFTSIRYDVVVIDGCDYIVFDAGSSYQNVIHKANCKNHKIN